MRRFAKLLSASFAILLGGAGFANAYTVNSAEGRFSIDFPSQPTIKHIRDVGTCMRDRYVFSMSAGEKVWTAAYQDCPHGYLEDIGPNQFMRDAWKNIVRQLPGELRANDLVKNHGMLGRQFLILVTARTRHYVVLVKRVLRMQVFVDGDRIYKLTYVGPVPSHEDPDVEAFFASFRVMR
jgi:hypothetical protein